MKRALPLFHGDACGQIGDRRTDDEATDGLAVPAIDIAEFCWESLAEQHRERTIGDGVLLTTLHAAKGLEFPHVLIADGGWDERGDHRAVKAGRQCPAAGGPSEDERRVFYVGMTRARETLTLFEITGGSHPHLPLLDAAASETHERSGTAQATAGNWLLREAPSLEPPPAAVIARRYTQLSLADLDLGYAGRQPPGAPIHRRLAALQAGDELGWRREATTASSYRAGQYAIQAAECSMPGQRPGRDDVGGTNGPSRTGRTATDSTELGQFLLTTLEGHPVARLSKRAAARWLPYADSIEAIRIIALIHRDRSQTEPEYATSLRCERWEIPLVEIRWRRRLRLAD
jgi:ATP-dependent DNA helicase RecQ